jgi:hypothetical protein
VLAVPKIRGYLARFPRLASLALQRRGPDHRFRLLALESRNLIAQYLNLFLLPMTVFQQPQHRRRPLVGRDIRDAGSF